MPHHHHHTNRNLTIAFFLNLAFTVLEVIGGLLTNSVAILSDALHDLGDSFSLGLSWYLDRKSKQKSTEQYSFGYQRFSLLGALVNSLVLIGGSVYIIYEAVGRILAPQHSNAQGMVLFAILGVAVNGYAAWKLSSGRTMNERVVSWHLLEDVLGWAAVLVVAIVLLFKDIHYLDPALSLAITIYILYNVVRRLRDTLHLFLQGVPEGVSAGDIERQLLAVPHVASLHHTHLWSLEGEHHVFTTHVVLEDIQTFGEILEAKRQMKDILKNYPFSHYTIETELDEESCELAG
ncbi:MAG: cation transporter [Phaeodactylibacter sp.]|nr:cation transporter [Phaeodactylibacter sp.]MCB9294191.1 cation transporter [Lewinellaceae bacterium]